MVVVKYFEDETKSGNAKVGIKGRGREGEKLVAKLLERKVLNWGPGLIMTSVGKNNTHLAYLSETNARSISSSQKKWVEKLVKFINNYYEDKGSTPRQSDISKKIGKLPAYKKKEGSSRSKSRSKSRSRQIDSSDDSSDSDDRRKSRKRSLSPKRRSRSKKRSDSDDRRKSKKRSPSPKRRSRSKKRSTSEDKRKSKKRSESEDKRKTKKRSASEDRNSSPKRKETKEEEVVNSVRAGDYIVESDYNNETDPSVQGIICDRIIKKGDVFTFTDSMKKTKIKDSVKTIHTFLGIVTHFTTKSHRTVTRSEGDFYVGKSKIRFVDTVSDKAYDIPEYTDEELEKLSKLGFISNNIKKKDVVINNFVVLLEGPIAEGKKARIYKEKVVDRTIDGIKLNSIGFPYEVTCKETYTYDDKKGNFYPMRVHMNNYIPNKVKMGEYYSLFTESNIYFAYYLCIPTDYKYDINDWGVISRIYKDDVSYMVFENFFFESDEDIKLFMFNANSNVAKGKLNDEEQGESYFKVSSSITTKTNIEKLIFEETKGDKGTYIKCVSILPNKILKVGTKVNLDNKEITITSDYLLPSGIPFKVEDIDYYKLLEEGKYSESKVITNKDDPEESIEQEDDSDSELEELESVEEEEESEEEEEEEEEDD